jgi:hypothetical protein
VVNFIVCTFASLNNNNMSKQQPTSYFLGDKSKEGHSIEQDICPCCGVDKLTYGEPIVQPDNVIYPWDCNHCNSSGEQNFSLEFQGHTVRHSTESVNDDGFNFHHTIELQLLQIFERIPMDRPENMNEIIEFVADDVMETADPRNWNSADVAIGLRRFIESGK